MRIIFKAAWRLPRGFTIGLESPPVELYSDCKKSFTLAIEPVDDFFQEIDRGWALWHLKSEDFSNKINIPWDEFSFALNSEITQQKELRLRKVELKNDPYFVKISGMAYTILLFKAELNIEQENLKRHNFFGQGDLIWDAPKTDYFYEIFGDDINRMKLAIGLENPSMEFFEPICEGSYSISDDDIVSYHLPLNMSSKGVYIPRSYSEENIASIQDRYDRIPKTLKFDRITELTSHGLNNEIDPVSSFVSIWNAFELLITEFNSQYENDVLFEKIPLQKFYNKNIRDNIIAKRNIGVADRFFRMAAALDASALDVDAKIEFDSFFRVKKSRDKISHGSSLTLDRVFLDELKIIFQKFIVLWINYKTPL